MDFIGINKETNEFIVFTPEEFEETYMVDEGYENVVPPKTKYKHPSTIEAGNLEGGKLTDLKRYYIIKPEIDGLTYCHAGEILQINVKNCKVRVQGEDGKKIWVYVSREQISKAQVHHMVAIYGDDREVLGWVKETFLSLHKTSNEWLKDQFDIIEERVGALEGCKGMVMVQHRVNSSKAYAGKVLEVHMDLNEGSYMLIDPVFGDTPIRMSITVDALRSINPIVDEMLVIYRESCGVDSRGNRRYTLNTMPHEEFIKDFKPS